MSIDLDGDSRSEVVENLDQQLNNNPIEVKYQEGLPPDYNDTLDFIESEEDQIKSISFYSSKKDDIFKLETEKEGDLKAVINLLEKEDSWIVQNVEVLDNEFSGRIDAYEQALNQALNSENILSYPVS